MTDKFVVTARARAEVMGVPDYPMAVVEHPTGRLPDEVLRVRAEQVSARVVELLLKD